MQAVIRKSINNTTMQFERLGYIANNMAHCLSKNDMDESKVEAIKDKAKLYNIKYKKTKR